MAQTARDYQPVIARFSAACEVDPRVLAAFVGGSLARGDADAYSDLDLGILTTDGERDALWADREAFLRRFGDPLLVEDFDQDVTVFFVFRDGTEGELSIGRSQEFAEFQAGPFVVLLDKVGALTGVSALEPTTDPGDQREVLRRQVMWFWHDLSHAIAAIGRGHRWWAMGQIETLRRMCVTLVRLDQDFAAEADEYDKVDLAVPAERLAPLEATVGALEPGPMLEAVHTLVEFYRGLARPLAERHGLRYPAELDALMVERLSVLDADIRGGAGG